MAQAGFHIGGRDLRRPDAAEKPRHLAIKMELHEIGQIFAREPRGLQSGSRETVHWIMSNITGAFPQP